MLHRSALWARQQGAHSRRTCLSTSHASVNVKSITCDEAGDLLSSERLFRRWPSTHHSVRVRPEHRRKVASCGDSTHHAASNRSCPRTADGFVTTPLRLSLRSVGPRPLVHCPGALRDDTAIASSGAIRLRWRRLDCCRKRPETVSRCRGWRPPERDIEWVAGVCMG